MGRPGRPRKSALKTVERKPIRPLERQRMRPWLLHMLEEGECDQIRWISKKDKTFRMSWKHAAGQNWDRGQDCNLFELWARHTGKYYDGDKPDHKRWKANFRCALNSLLDVEEQKEKGVRKGTNAYKVYKFLEHKRQKKPPAIKVEPMEEDECMYMASSNGTKSRPRQQACDLDSEGSELGMAEQDDYFDYEIAVKEEEKEHSPLPHFDQICPFTDLQSPYCPSSRFQETGSPQTCRFQEAGSPQTHSSFSSSDDDNQSTTSSAPTDEEVISILLEQGDDEVDFWERYMIDTSIQESPEELITEDGEPISDYDGPSVVVMPELEPSPDFTLTSLTKSLC